MKNIEPLNELDKQIILYAKGWYGDGVSKGSGNGIIADVKRIMSEVCAIDSIFISEHDVFGCLVSAYVKVGLENYLTSVESITELCCKKWFGNMSDYNRKPEEVIIGALTISNGDSVRGVEPLFKFNSKG